jgi:DNA-binding transcriptional ArsR family regulator
VVHIEAALLVVAALAALAQASHLAIFRALVQAGPAGLSAGKIGEIIGIPPSSLSFHLKELAHANMVSSRQEGRFVIYVANSSTMNALCLSFSPRIAVAVILARQSIPRPVLLPKRGHHETFTRSRRC